MDELLTRYRWGRFERVSSKFGVTNFKTGIFFGAAFAFLICYLCFVANTLSTLTYNDMIYAKPTSLILFGLLLIGNVVIIVLYLIVCGVFLYNAKKGKDKILGEMDDIAYGFLKQDFSYEKMKKEVHSNGKRKTQ